MSKPRFLTPWVTAADGQQQQQQQQQQQYRTISTDELESAAGSGGSGWSNNNNNNNDNKYLRPADYNSNTTRIESTVSIGTSKQIQQHLDSGNAIYFGVDPRDCSRIRRDTTQCSEFLAKRLQRFQRTGGSGADERRSVLMKIVCGLSLDCVAKITLVAGLYLGAHLCLTGTETFIAKKADREGFSFLIAILQIVWGAYFSSVCIFGMSLMWGKFRRSPTAALLFSIIWTFTTFVILVTAGLFFYFFHSGRSALISNCRARTVRAGPRRWDVGQDAPRRSAPKDRIEACIESIQMRGMALLVYAIAHLFMALFALVVVAWARDYRGRLRTIEQFRLLQERYKCEDEKVELVIGTVPIGMRGRAQQAERTAAACPLSAGTPRSTRPRTSLMDMFGVLPISGRRSELYATGGPPPLPAPPPLAVVREEGSVVSTAKVL